MKEFKSDNLKEVKNLTKVQYPLEVLDEIERNFIPAPIISKLYRWIKAKFGR